MPIPASIDYGQVAAAYDNSRCIEPAIGVALIDGLRALGARSVLAIGTGTGNYTGALTASGLLVIALDRSPEMVEIGAHKTSARWNLSDVHVLPLRTRSLDAIAVARGLTKLERDLDSREFARIAASFEAAHAAAADCVVITAR